MDMKQNLGFILNKAAIICFPLIGVVAYLCRMFTPLVKLIWRLWGWKMRGATDPYQVDKGVLIAYPHTSNWDFPVGLMIRKVISAPHIAFVGKASLFKFPFGGLMKSIGGIPVDRSKSSNFVDAVVDMLNNSDRLIVCVAPEGKRSKPEVLKTGFYYMALKANVPLIMVQFDWKNKITRFREPYHLTGNWETDYRAMAEYFDSIEGYHPKDQYDFDVSKIKERYPKHLKSASK